MKFSELPTLTPQTKQRLRSYALVVAAASAVFLPFIGSFGLWDPWETHYGEVGRQITERNDWISTWWGSHWQDAGGSQEGTYFYSKPILLMWLMAIGLSVFGISEIGIRLGVALVSILAVALVYKFGASVFRRRTGVIMAAVVGTSPMWFFLTRQAQTDMPFVGLMTIAMCFFMMGMFGKDREDTPDKVSYGITFGWILAVVVPQLTLLIAGLTRWRGSANSFMDPLTTPGTRAVIYGSIVLGIGGVILIAALLSPRQSKRRFRLALLALATQVVPHLVVLIGALIASSNLLKDLNGWYSWGPVQASQYSAILGFAIYWTFTRFVPTRRRLYLFGFYVFAGLATLAKGLLGFMLPGAILFIYILTTRRWRMLKDAELHTGIPIFIAVSFPWYAAMLIRHTSAFWNRFFVHDHFKRLATGVHQIDTGSFEHFAKWLGYGLFPWSAYVPALVARIFGGEPLKRNDTERHAVYMLVIWMIVAFSLFTLSSTKFHHYIFPAMPAIALLVALLIDDVLDEPFARPWALFLFALPIAGLLAWDVVNDPQIFKNLFTYKYDRKWNNAGWDLEFRRATVYASIPMFVGMLLLLVKNALAKKAGFGLMVTGGVVLALFCLNVYMPRISQTWSQKGLWDYYYDACTKTDPPPNSDRRKTYCKEPVVSYKLNWRGETYYSQNQVIPIRDDDDFTHFLSEVGDGTFYGIMENGRYRGGFKRNLPKRFKNKACIVYNQNMKFVLAKVPCEKNDPMRVDESKK